MNKVVATASLCLSTLLAGCASERNSMDTVSGKPEVMLPRATPEQVENYLKDHMINLGFSLEKDTDPMMLVFGRRGKQPPSKPSWGYRVTYSITDEKPGTRVMADVTMVSDQGTPRERPYEGVAQPTDDLEA